MKAYDAIADAIAAEGTEVVFGVLGDGNMYFMPRLVDHHGVRFVSARHEAAAVSMADGYFRATGRPGICTVTHGPGLTQTGTPLTAARLNRSGVLLIAGDTPPAFRHHGQNIDQQPFAMATAGAFQPARSPVTLAEDIQLAWRHVRLGHGPIVFNVAIDLQRSELPDDWRYTPSSTVVAPTQARPPEPAALERVAELLRRAERPVIVAGRGAVRADAREALIALADSTGALLSTTLLAKGWFAGHPYDLGIAGGFSHPVAMEALAQADLVLAFGASLNLFTVSHGTLFPRAQVVQVEVDPGAVGHTTAVDVALLGDARLVAEGLLAAVGSDAGSGADPGSTRAGASRGLRSPELAARLDGYDPLAEEERDPVVPGDGADPRDIARVCDELLPRGRVVLVGIGHYSGYQAMYVGVDHPDDLILPWQLGSVGLGLPTALGAAVARPDQTVVVFEGDGGLMMSLQELETAARCKIPLLVIVLDDAAYGAESHMMRRHGLDPSLSFFDNPDFPAVARSLGLRAWNAETADELRVALGEALPLQGPSLIRVNLSRSVVHHQVFKALTG